MRPALLLLLCLFVPLLAGAASPSPVALEILWRDHEFGGLQWRTFDAAGKALTIAQMPDPPIIAHLAGNPPVITLTTSPDDPFGKRVPLGSLWKLFVYLWLVEERQAAPNYICSAPQGHASAARKQREEELYCCDPGHDIDRDTALLRSCAPFFAPTRLAIDPTAWREFWEARPGVRLNAPWLAGLDAMKPDTEVSPASLLHALEAAPARAREQAANVLLARVFTPAPGAALDATTLARHTGGQLRIKTFSWHLSNVGDTARSPYGGGAGWLADGTALWFAGKGTGQQVMARFGAPLGTALAAALPAEGATLAPGCVKVNFFARYPFTIEQRGGKPAAAGELRGHYVARFEHNKVSIPFVANGELSLSTTPTGARLSGRFGIDDYVARVIDREGDASATEAARALAVVVRSYLMNEAEKSGNCLVIDDSSRTQRVSINPPGAAARAVTGFTTGLVLRGVAVGYHHDTPATNRMAWTEAVAASRAGTPWDLILRQAFPAATLGAMFDPAGVPCKRFAQAETWLAARTPRWHRLLYPGLPGFDPPATPQICLLDWGTPFSEQERGRIHLRALQTSEDRITLAHEYLHLGLRHHPSGHDEALVEHWARRLTEE